MSCSCIIDMDCYDESMKIYSEKWVVAVKDHVCGECGSKINKGDEYENIRGKWGGVFETQKTCESCYSARSLFFCSGWYFGDVWGDIEGFISSTYDENIPWSDIGKLLKPARDRICDFIEKNWKTE